MKGLHLGQDGFEPPLGDRIHEVRQSGYPGNINIPFRRCPDESHVFLGGRGPCGAQQLGLVVPVRALDPGLQGFEVFVQVIDGPVR